MTLYEEIYFEINFAGEKAELRKLASFLKSGELDDFFEVSSEYISYADGFKDLDDAEKSELTFTNDDMGIEVDEFEVADFLDVLCKAGKRLEISGNIYDINDEEYSFTSAAGDSYFQNSRNVSKFNDELDEAAEEEEEEERD
ncbi:MAG: hypothetical protein J6Q68_00565 [Clostridia bacterium]|nr:hypothetical protein [Clostridia bacterium]